MQNIANKKIKIKETAQMEERICLFEEHLKDLE